LIQYWAVALSEQSEDEELRNRFAETAKQLVDNEAKIMEEIMATEGKSTDIGGYYLPDDELAGNAMRPSKTLNSIIAAV